MSADSRIFDVNGADFAERVLERSATVPVLVDFWAEWCGPCRSLGPVLEALAREHDGAFELAKVDADRNQELCAAYGVRGLPTVKLVKDGRVVGEFVGAQPESAVRALLAEHLPRASDAAIAEARDRLAAGDAPAARALLERAVESDPDNERVVAPLVTVLLELGEIEAARAHLARVPLARRNRAYEALEARTSLAEAALGAPGTELLEQALEADPADSASRYRLAARRALAGRHEDAMQQMLELMRRDRAFGEDAGRRGLLSVFALLDEGDPLVSRYRSRMASILH